MRPASLIVSAVFGLTWLTTLGCGGRTGVEGWTRYDLYFGRDVSVTGVVVNDEVSRLDFERYLDAELSPHVGGLTVYEADGRYAAAGRIEAERSFVVTILSSADDAERVRSTIDRAVAAYVERFHQQSVLVATSDASVRFIEGR